MAPSILNELGQLARALDALAIPAPVTHVYNPLTYARAPHARYWERFGQGPKEVVFLGMNPGPWGMAQTGVPFGEVSLVRDWMGIEEAVGKPAREHPKRAVDGFDCHRSEVSGRRLWGWAAQRFGTAEAFFSRFFVVNYCPLMFMEETGRNRTPDKLPAAVKEKLFTLCDETLARMIEALDPNLVVGVGKFAEDRARAGLGDAIPIGRICHPSPANPKANRGWATIVEEELAALGVKV